MRKSVTIIAEAGVNHNGDVNIAVEMIKQAARAGADYVKFQTFEAGELVTRDAPQAVYQKKNLRSGENADQYSMLHKLMLSKDAYRFLRDVCVSEGIGFVSTPFDFSSADLLEPLNMDFWKIPSGEITNLPLLIRLARSGIPVILSTGMSELEEVHSAVNVLREHGAREITLLHCNTDYPTPYEDVNLLAMQTIRESTGLPVGYSDHTLGIEVSLAAVALGAVVIEKHFTLDPSMEGPDHKASLMPEQLQEMVTCIRHIEQALGSSSKEVTPSEAKNLHIARKSLVAIRPIKKGELFTEENLMAKRPGAGVSPMRWFEIIGTPANRDYREDESIEFVGWDK